MVRQPDEGQGRAHLGAAPAFWRINRTSYLGDYLDALLIRPVVDGERITADEGTEQPVCATHETPCIAEWICPECVSENPALDEAVAALNEAHAEIRDLEARVEHERNR